MKQIFKMGFKALVVAVAATAIATGCSTVPLRTEKSTSGISAAEEAGAAKIPQASLYLQMAKEELELAKELAAKNEREKAESMLLRAEADAELAAAISHEEAEKAEAQAAVKRVRQLWQENP